MVVWPLHPLYLLNTSPWNEWLHDGLLIIADAIGEIVILHYIIVGAGRRRADSGYLSYTLLFERRSYRCQSKPSPIVHPIKTPVCRDYSDCAEYTETFARPAGCTVSTH